MFNNKPKTSISGLSAPMMINDIDTDIIIPAQHLTQTSKSGYGQHAFARLRKADVNFVLNQARYHGAKVLIAGDNFGCGSSREHAVWAIQEIGFEAIIAPSFADIFSNNARKNGLVLIELDDALCHKLADASIQRDLLINIDLVNTTINAGQFNCSFPINRFFQHCITQGHDEIDYLLSHMPLIENHKVAIKDQALFIQNGQLT